MTFHSMGRKALKITQDEHGKVREDSLTKSQRQRGTGRITANCRRGSGARPFKEPEGGQVHET